MEVKILPVKSFVHPCVVQSNRDEPPPPPAHGLSCSLSSARRIWIVLRHEFAYVDAPTNQILKDLKSQILLPRVCYAKSF
ncbi:hypothetical protein OsI_38479 [Oryza sativa Indica Group]|uniref:Uncharacterized protein n=2 Tax=Oryza sativa TaxID=4530 RepID=B9GDD3_ORYSJ|nr:hypothetical protein OsI_38479 [Oryza sativa Indica Group]EEE53290.1 hypothetical protein OsJ_36248 [Oryza sativa Japonica Group]